MKKIKNFLLEGQPGSGKTTLILKMVRRLDGHKLGGFYTEEIRETGERTGFHIRTLDGKEDVLAHVDLKYGTRVGRYGVNVSAFEEMVIPCLQQAVKESNLILIDEIGKMELFSERFRMAVLACLSSDVPVVATIMVRSHPFADQIKMRPDVKRMVVTKEEQLFIIKEIVEELGLD